MKYVFDRRAQPPAVVLSGAIDEAAGSSLMAVRKDINETKHVVIDCAGVTMVNSVGVRLWQKFLQSLSTIDYEFVNCSVFFVDYANLSPILVRGAKIKSFHAPFACTDCGKTRDILLVSAAIKGEDLGRHRCVGCGGEMRSEVEAGRYVHFLAAGSGAKMAPEG